MHDVFIWRMSTEALSPIEKLLFCAKLSDYNLKDYISENMRPGMSQLLVEDTDLAEIFKKVKKSVTMERAHGPQTSIEFIPNYWKFE
jgi:hypothetical protein